MSAGNSPYRLSYNYYDVNLENLVLDRTIIPEFIFYFILMTSILDIVRRSSLMGGKGLINPSML